MESDADLALAIALSLEQHEDQDLLFAQQLQAEEMRLAQEDLAHEEDIGFIPAFAERPAPTLELGSQLEDTGSIFQAHLATVNNQEDVNAVLRELYNNNPTVAKASCAPHAYVFGETSRGCEDGGEDGAGKRLAELLVQHKCDNVFVMVTRECYGPMLGGRRWNHFLNCARELIEQCGHSNKKAPKKTKKKKKNSKKQRVGSHIEGSGGSQEVNTYKPTKKQRNYSKRHKDHC